MVVIDQSFGPDGTRRMIFQLFQSAGPSIANWGCGLVVGSRRVGHLS